MNYDIHNNLVLKITSDVINVFRDQPKLRPLFIIFPIAAISACVFAFLDQSKALPPKAAEVGAMISLGILALTAISLSAYQTVIEDKLRKKRTEEKEEEVKKYPEKTRAAWDLAQDKLERYLDRNIAQVRSIYWLCVCVILFGFALISYGAVLVYRSPEALSASVLSSISGVLVTFLGGTLIFVYKATMSQAKDYVTMLERINAVGMSLQIIDSLDAQNHELKDKSKAELARELLKIYGTERSHTRDAG